MSAHDARFAAEIAAVYAENLVPLLFEPYALDLAERIDRTGARDILETAAGTGALTRAIVGRRPDVRIVATDLNAPMLERAASHGGTRIEWRVADALDLPFDAGTFDAVVCQFGIMFFPDRARAYAEARRVLRAGGRWMFSVWDALEANPLPQAVFDALAARYPADPPGFMARVPHGYHDVGRIRAELRAAGYDEIGIDAVELTARAPDARHVAVAFCTGTPLRHEIGAREPDGLERVVDAATHALESRFGTRAIEAPMRAYVVDARA